MVYLKLSIAAVLLIMAMSAPASQHATKLPFASPGSSIY